MKIIIYGKSYEMNECTEFSEKRCFIDLKGGRNLEITHETNLFEKKDYFFSVRLNCSDKEFDEEKYSETNGVIKNFSANTLDELTVLIEQMVNRNDIKDNAMKIHANTYDCFCENLYRMFKWQDVDKIEADGLYYIFKDSNDDIIAEFDEYNCIGYVY